MRLNSCPGKNASQSRLNICSIAKHGACSRPAGSVFSPIAYSLRYFSYLFRRGRQISQLQPMGVQWPVQTLKLDAGCKSKTPAKSMVLGPSKRSDSKRPVHSHSRRKRRVPSIPSRRARCHSKRTEWRTERPTDRASKRTIRSTIPGNSVLRA